MRQMTYTKLQLNFETATRGLKNKTGSKKSAQTECNSGVQEQSVALKESYRLFLNTRSENLCISLYLYFGIKLFFHILM